MARLAEVEGGAVPAGAMMGAVLFAYKGAIGPIEATTAGASVVTALTDVTGATLEETTTAAAPEEMTGAALEEMTGATLVTGAALDAGLVRVQGQSVMVKRVA